MGRKGIVMKEYIVILKDGKNHYMLCHHGKKWQWVEKDVAETTRSGFINVGSTARDAIDQAKAMAPRLPRFVINPEFSAREV